MKLTKQDHSIMLTLMESEEPLTAYAISKATGIAQPQVKYRLTKLLSDSVIEEVYENKFDVHPALRDGETINLITEKLFDIAYAIDNKKETTADGMKQLIDFVIERTEVKNTNNSS